MKKRIKIAWSMCILIILLVPFLIRAQENYEKLYFIHLKDGSVIETLSYVKTDKHISFKANGLPGFVSLSQIDSIEEITREDIYRKIIRVATKNLKSWDPMKVWIDKNQNAIVIKLNMQKITEQNYTLIITSNIIELVYSIPNGWSNIREIKIINSSRLC